MIFLSIRAFSHIINGINIYTSVIDIFVMVAFLPRSEFEALQTKYLETHAEKENLELQYNSKAEFEDPPTRVRRIWIIYPYSSKSGKYLYFLVLLTST